MTRPSSPRVVDILADLAIQDAVDDYLQGADQIAAHQLWVRERLEGEERTGLAWTDRLGDYPPLERVYEDVEVVVEHDFHTAHGDHTAAEVK